MLLDGVFITAPFWKELPSDRVETVPTTSLFSARTRTAGIRVFRTINKAFRNRASILQWYYMYVKLLWEGLRSKGGDITVRNSYTVCFTPPPPSLLSPRFDFSSVAVQPKGALIRLQGRRNFCGGARDHGRRRRLRRNAYWGDTKVHFGRL